VDEPRWTARELEVISELRALGRDVDPDPATTARIRADIERKLEHEPDRRRRALATVLAAAAALIVVAGGVGLLLSRGSLPGDPLYGVKRASESAELQFTFDDAARGAKHLRFAANRLDELSEMRSPDTTAFLTTLSAFAVEARSGTAQLTPLGVRGDAAAFTTLRTWAHEQRAKLVALAPPSGARDELERARALLNRIDQRALALTERLSCYRITTGSYDDLGAVPAAGECSVAQDALFGAPAPVPPPLADSPSPEPVEIMTAPAGPTSSGSTAPVVPLPTAPVTSSEATPTETVWQPPISAPTSPRTPSTSTPTPQPLISIPPLVPGLPGLGIG